MSVWLKIYEITTNHTHACKVNRWNFLIFCLYRLIWLQQQQQQQKILTYRQEHVDNICLLYIQNHKNMIEWLNATHIWLFNVVFNGYLSKYPFYYNWYFYTYLKKMKKKIYNTFATVQVTKWSRWNFVEIRVIKKYFINVDIVS